MTALATETLPLSSECTLAAQPGYADLHRECRQTEDVPLPHTRGIWLIRRCGCPHHTDNHRQPAPAGTTASVPERERP